MSDAPDKKLTPDAKEKLTTALRDKLKRDRFKRSPWLVGGGLLTMAAIVAIWYGFQPGTAPPRVMLIGYDALRSGGVVKAQLVAPGEPDATLYGLEIDWRLGDEAKTTKTDARGVATFPFAGADRKANSTVRIIYSDRPDGHNRRDKSSQVFSHESFGDPIVVVPIDQVLANGKSIDWSEKELRAYPKPPTRSEIGIKECRNRLKEPCAVIYASGDVGWETYQRMRDWLKLYQDEKDADVAAGPLLHERAEAIEARLKGARDVRRWSAK